MKKIFFALGALDIALLLVLSIVLLLQQNSPAQHVDSNAAFFVGNFHSHTTTSDGKNTYDEMIEAAKALGLDFLVITDHQQIGNDTRAKCLEEKRLLCVIGEEISTTKGHLLAIGIVTEIPAGLSPEETINRIHRQDGLAIPAHPESKKTGKTGWNGLDVTEIKKLQVDAVECHQRGKESKNYVCDLLPNVPKVFDSDAHNTDALRNLASNCLLDNLSVEALKKAVKEGKCKEFIPGAG